MLKNFAKLNENWLLRGWDDFPWALVNCKNGDVRYLRKKQFYVAESCDGNTNFNSLAFLPEHIFLLNEFIKDGIVEKCSKGNLIHHYQEYRVANNSRLIGIHWCLTGYCNLNCIHCYMESPSGRYGELPLDKMIEIINQFELANVAQVSLTGGEPFLRKDIIEIIKVLTEKKICINQIFTNGLLISKEHLDNIKKMGILPSFQISFDGKNFHDYMRGTKGIENKVIESIKLLKTNGFNVTVATSIDKINAISLSDTFDCMKDLGVNSWRVAAPNNAGNWKGTTTALSLNEKHQLFSELIKKWNKNKRPFAFQLDVFFNSNSFKNAEPLKENKYSKESYDCGAIRGRANLLPDGVLVPCTSYVGTKIQEMMPNLLFDNLSVVWNKSFLREIADIKKKSVTERIPECAKCTFFEECGAGCRASALTETGNFWNKDPISCDIWKTGIKDHIEKLALDSSS